MVKGVAAGACCCCVPPAAAVAATVVVLCKRGAVATLVAIVLGITAADVDRANEAAEAAALAVGENLVSVKSSPLPLLTPTLTGISVLDGKATVVVVADAEPRIPPRDRIIDSASSNCIGPNSD